MLVRLEIASGSGTIMSLSSWATSSVEEVYKDRNVVAQLLRRAERAGFKAIALTNFEGLDLGKMDMANDSGLASYVAGQIDRTLSWKQIDRCEMASDNHKPATSDERLRPVALEEVVKAA
uniref:Uncharacterized protein n=1 Tax=Brassica oleracea var. oleracea TaxID=109376 RepID=A0A0D3D1K4_BRAOL